MNRKTLLVIDDELSFTSALKAELASRGDFEVHVVHEADQALATVQTIEPDLVIIDVVMPRMLGSEIAALFLTALRMRSIPVVFLTPMARGRYPLRSYGTLCGYPVFAKPAHARLVYDLIEQQINRSTRHALKTRPIRLPPTRPPLAHPWSNRVPSRMT